MTASDGPPVFLAGKAFPSAGVPAGAPAGAGSSNLAFLPPSPASGVPFLLLFAPAPALGLASRLAARPNEDPAGLGSRLSEPALDDDDEWFL